MQKLILAGAGAAVAAILLSGSVTAAFYSLFGGADIVIPDSDPDAAVSLVSDYGADEADVSQIFFEVPSGLTFGELVTLSLDYSFVDGDCYPDSPRFSFSLDIGAPGGNDGVMDVWVARGPDFTGCTPTWVNTGNLIGNNDAGRYIFHDEDGGHTPGSYSEMLAIYEDAVIVGFFQLIVDGGWQDLVANGGNLRQEILVDNVNINGEVYTFEQPTPPDAPSCKNGGWEDLTRADGSPFKNQGECLRYFHSGK